MQYHLASRPQTQGGVSSAADGRIYSYNNANGFHPIDLGYAPRRPVFCVSSHPGLILEHPEVVCHPTYSVPQVFVPDDALHGPPKGMEIPKSIFRSNKDSKYNITDRKGRPLTHPCRCGVEMRFSEVWFPPPPDGRKYKSREEVFRDTKSEFMTAYDKCIEGINILNPEVIEKAVRDKAKLRR
jgi:hypothetical protein